MPRRRLSELVGWVALVAALIAMFRLGRIEGRWPVVAIAAALCATAVMVFVRSQAGLSQLQQLLVEGRPRPMLRLVRARLRYRGGGRNRGALLIFKAAAQSMCGRFEDGLATLDELDIENELPDEDRDSWLFSYHTTHFSCLLFAERIAEARRVFDDEIEPRGAADNIAVRAMAAQLDYCEGEHIRAERCLEEILEDDKTPPVSRGVFHYFLGRIYLDRNQESKANAQFAEARTLAAATWIPAGIDALLREAEAA